MFYKGEIEQINKVVISDPSYSKNVWCRYESNTIDNGGPWRVQLAVNDVSDIVDGYEIKGVDFSLLLSSNLIFEKACELNRDGRGFAHPKMLEMKETEIGMDTACVALGVNDVADEIIASRDEWQPDCALRTLTDGMFGTVYEGSHEGVVYFLCIGGFFDEDTGHTVEDVVQYLTSAFKIKSLELVKDEPCIEEKIADAKAQTEESTKNNEKSQIHER